MNIKTIDDEISKLEEALTDERAATERLLDAYEKRIARLREMYALQARKMFVRHAKRAADFRWRLGKKQARIDELEKALEHITNAVLGASTAATEVRWLVMLVPAINTVVSYPPIYAVDDIGECTMRKYEASRYTSEEEAKIRLALEREHRAWPDAQVIEAELPQAQSTCAQPGEILTTTQELLEEISELQKQASLLPEIAQVYGCDPSKSAIVHAVTNLRHLAETWHGQVQEMATAMDNIASALDCAPNEAAILKAIRMREDREDV